jgi:hypothetical protein
MRAIALNAAISGSILAEPEVCWFTALALDCPAGPSTIRCTQRRSCRGPRAAQLTDPEKLKQFQDAQNQLTGALGRLIAISENYPELKSNQNFLALQSQLEGTENRIAVARRDYIEAVRAYNTELKTFPGMLWAATFFRSNKPMAEFQANEDAQKPPQVKF